MSTQEGHEKLTINDAHQMRLIAERNYRNPELSLKKIDSPAICTMQSRRICNSWKIFWNLRLRWMKAPFICLTHSHTHRHLCLFYTLAAAPWHRLLRAVMMIIWTTSSFGLKKLLQAPPQAVVGRCLASLFSLPRCRQLSMFVMCLSSNTQDQARAN